MEMLHWCLLLLTDQFIELAVRQWAKKEGEREVWQIENKDDDDEPTAVHSLNYIFFLQLLLYILG